MHQRRQRERATAQAGALEKLTTRGVAQGRFDMRGIHGNPHGAVSHGARAESLINVNKLVQAHQNLAEVTERLVLRLGRSAVAVHLSVDEVEHPLALDGTRWAAQRR